MGIADKDLADEILVAGRHAGAPLAAAPLGAVGRERHPLDVAAVRDGHHHILARDQVFQVLFELRFLNPGAAGVAKAFLHLHQFIPQDGEQPGPGIQDLQVIGDLHGEAFELLADLVALQPGQPLQTQIQNGLGLDFREAIGAVLVQTMPRLVDQFDERRHVARRPGPVHQLLARDLRVRRRPDQADHVVDVGHRDGEAGQHMRARARLAQLVGGAAGDHLFAEIDEGRDDPLEVQQLRPAAVERQHVYAEGRLQRGKAVELVEDDLAHGVAAQVDDHAQALAVAFVAQVRYPLDDLVADHFGDALDHARLVDLIGHLGNDDRLPVLGPLLDRCPAAHDDGAAPRVVGLADATPAEDQRAGGKIRSLHVGHQPVD